jgi:hypothetical protein
MIDEIIAILLLNNLFKQIQYWFGYREQKMSIRYLMNEQVYIHSLLDKYSIQQVLYISYIVLIE